LQWPAPGGTLAGSAMQIRINIRKTKGLIWLLGAGALVLAGWTFWDIYTQKQDKKYDARSSKFFHDELNQNVVAQPVSTRKPFYSKDDYEKLWDCLIDGSVRPPVVPVGPEVAPVQAKPKAPPIDTIVQVGLIVWSPEPAERIAAVSYKSGGGAAPAPAPAAGVAAAAAGTVPSKERLLHLSEGDPLEPPYDGEPYNGKVLTIDEQEVTFQWGEGQATITPKLGKDGNGKPVRLFDVPAPEEDPAAALTEVPAETKELTKGHWIIGTKDRERANKDLKVFLDQELSVRTVTPSGGGRSSLELTDVQPNSLAAQFGAQKGDRIISVNGIPMNSYSGAVNWFKQNSNESQYVVVYERNGKQDSVVIHSK
jgi:membrane-associated protease RseP (regulator of RpoE activity)